MSVFKQYNQGSPFEFETPEDFEYKNLIDLYAPEIDNTFKINAIFINTKSKFGDSPVVATDNELINLPMHLTQACKDMMRDNDVVQAVNNGSAGIEIYEYNSKKWGINYSVNFKEI